MAPSPPPGIHGKHPVLKHPSFDQGFELNSLFFRLIPALSTIRILLLAPFFKQIIITLTLKYNRKVTKQAQSYKSLVIVSLAYIGYFLFVLQSPSNLDQLEMSLNCLFIKLQIGLESIQ